MRFHPRANGLRARPQEVETSQMAGTSNDCIQIPNATLGVAIAFSRPRWPRITGCSGSGTILWRCGTTVYTGGTTFISVSLKFNEIR